MYRKVVRVLAAIHVCGSTDTQHRLHYETIALTHTDSYATKLKRKTNGGLYYLHLTDRQIHVLVHTWRECVRVRKSQTHTNERCLPFYKDSVCTRTIQFNIVLKLDCLNWRKKNRNNRANENRIHIHSMGLTKKFAMQNLNFATFLFRKFSVFSFVYIHQLHVHLFLLEFMSDFLLLESFKCKYYSEENNFFFKK